MNANNERIERAGRLGPLAYKQFESEARELIASFDKPTLDKAIWAFLQLECRNEIKEGDPSLSLYLPLIRRAFITLFDEGSIQPVAEISKLGSAALAELRRATGIGVEALPAPVVELTPAQRLEAEVENDWKTLSGQQIRKKRDGSKAYAATLDRLLNSDRLGAQITRNVVMS